MLKVNYDIVILLVFCVMLEVCSENEKTDFFCNLNQEFPYPPNASYLGIHANPRNNDLVPCTTSSNYKLSWHMLKGFGIAQPNTFSPDGEITYITSSQPNPEDCTVHALSTKDGSELWCISLEGVISSSIEVDFEGNLYLTTRNSIVSLFTDGTIRWLLEISQYGSEDSSNSGIGLHFTPDGHVATLTNDGKLLLISRKDGEIISRLDIPSVYGFFNVVNLDDGINFKEFLPVPVQLDFERLFGSDTNIRFGVLAGSGGKFTNNTIGIAPNGDIYVIGGGPTTDNGALIQIRVEGAPESPSLVPGWYVVTNAGSASSPSISPDGRWVKVTDGNSANSFQLPQNSNAVARIVNIDDCNKNTDSNPDPDICVEAFSPRLLLGPSLFATPMLNGALHYLLEIQLADLFNNQAPDIRFLNGEESLFEIKLPDGLQWTSVLTITNNHIIGTATRFTESDQKLITVTLPAKAFSELVILDRNKGNIVFRSLITDDSSSTVVIGPDSSLYVNMLAFLHALAIDTPVVGGIIKFEPVFGN